jgi:hypothetical protein
VEAKQMLRRKGKKVGTGGKELTEERESRKKKGEEELGEGEKELYQTVQINLDPKGMGHVVSSPLFLKLRTKNDEGVPKKIDLKPLS